jgi:hypothetical protein
MPLGPGVYDHLCSMVREETDAEVTMVTIIKGNQGSGFSVQAKGGPMGALLLAETLEIMAKQIRQGLAQ